MLRFSTPSKPDDTETEEEMIAMSSSAEAGASSRNVSSSFGHLSATGTALRSFEQASPHGLDCLFKYMQAYMVRFEG